MLEARWGDLEKYIMIEGFYFFGGRWDDMITSNDLTIFKVKKLVDHKPIFSIIKPKTLG